MKISKMILSKKRMHRNLAYTALFAFSMYICYKTYQTQRRIREGFNPAEDPVEPDETKDAIAEKSDEIKEICAGCPNDAKMCLPAKTCITMYPGADNKETRDECNANVKKCRDSVPACKKICPPEKKTKTTTKVP